jgi:hypothetical protein
MSRLLAFLRRPWATVTAAVLAVALVAGAGTLLTPTAAEVVRVPTVEPVASAEFVCPITFGTQALTSAVSAGVAPLPGISAGRATLSELSTKPSTPPQVVTTPGKPIYEVITGRTLPPRIARATGSFAAGFGADQTARSGDGATRGLAASPCQRPITDGWLLGGATTVGRVTQVVLVNDDDRAAQVDLVVTTEAGESATPAATGIVVPGLSRRIVRLDTLAPDQNVTAIHVIARSGRIVASALMTAAVGNIPLGISVLPVTQASTRVVIPGVPGAVTNAKLILLAPESDTDVSVSLLSADGSFVPAGLDAISLEAGKLTSLDLTPALGGENAGLLITAESPVLAAVGVSVGTALELRETDFTAGTAALTAPGVISGLQGGAYRNAVSLAAPAAGAQVQLDLYVGTASTRAWTTTVTLAPGSSQRFEIPVTTSTPDGMLVITPMSGGSVYVTRQLEESGTRGPMIAFAPVYPTRATTVVPPVAGRPGLSVG